MDDAMVLHGEYVLLFTYHSVFSYSMFSIERDVALFSLFRLHMVKILFPALTETMLSFQNNVVFSDMPCINPSTS